MKLKTTHGVSAIALSAFLISCGEKEHDHSDDRGHSHEKEELQNDTAEGEEEGHDHAHNEVDLGKFDIQQYKVRAAQDHGAVEAGKEGHLVITLPYKDDGQSIVRAWIGTEDRTMSSVGKGEYAPSHDDYDIHAIAPSPLPAGAKWWVEIEKPDGTKAVGSIPLLKDVAGQ